MPVTQEQLIDLVDGLLTVAKSNRERKGYKSEFAQAAVCVGPQLERAVVPLQWRTNEEKHNVMHALAASAKEMNVMMIALITDVRWCDSDSFCNYFHIALPQESGIEKFQEEYGEILRGIYGGKMENLPRELWNEAIVVYGKGPMVEDYSRFAFYREGKNNTVEWYAPKPDKDYETRMHVLPDWWEQTTTQ